MSNHRSRVSPRHIALAAVVVLGATACSNRDETAPVTESTAAVTTTAATTDTAVTGSTEPTTSEVTSAPTEAPGIMFGDMPSPCGPGDATIAEGENGGDTLKLATANDKGSDVAPGLDKELYDAGVAFAGWCNEQGGIGGLPIEIIDADGKLFNVPAAMETVCTEAFAMVGGGWAFDDQQFPRFHECKMIDIAGYAVTTMKSMSNGLAQPVPNSSTTKPGFWWKWAKENHPDAIARTGVVYADIPAASLSAQAFVEIMEQLGGYEVVEYLPHNPAGEANWTPFAQKLKDSEVSLFTFVGAPETLAPMLKAMAEIDYEPELMMFETNFYTDSLIQQAGDAAEGAIARTTFVPFSEADRAPAMADYLSMMDTYNNGGKTGTLGLQSISAFLLFAQSANACIAANDGVLDRECVLAEANSVTEWTGGGLHGQTNPAERQPSTCGMLVQVVDGEWTRLWPELGGPEDAGNGFGCDPDSLFTMTGDYGDVNAGVDPTR